MAKTIRFADSPLLDAMREAARDVAEIHRAFGREFTSHWAADSLVGLSAAPTYRAALRTAFPQ